MADLVHVANINVIPPRQWWNADITYTTARTIVSIRVHLQVRCNKCNDVMLRSLGWGIMH